MSVPIIIDAGPSLNFFATRNERVLFHVVGKGLAAPETVRDEVLAKSRSDPRFGAAGGVWRKLEGSWITLLPDDVTPDLEAAAQLVIGGSLAPRMRKAKDLGETMVVMHAVAMANRCQDVHVIIDDMGGRALANARDWTEPARVPPPGY